MSKSKKSIDATTIKIVAVICMFIDHFAAAILNRMVEYGIFATNVTLRISAATFKLEQLIVWILRGIGRISFPIFCFFIVEGFFYTKNRWKYALRLLLFAVISEVPFDLAIFGYVVYGYYQNVYFTLLIGMLTIWGMDVMKDRTEDLFTAIMFRIGACFIPALYMAGEIRNILSIFFEDLSDSTIGDTDFSVIWICTAAFIYLITVIYQKKYGKTEVRIFCSRLCLLGIGMLAADLLSTDYGSIGIVTIVLMYLLRGRGRKIFAPLFSIIVLSLTNFSEAISLVDVLLFAKYDGKRGKGMKYFFYIFYPAHLLLLGIVARCMKLI